MGCKCCTCSKESIGSNELKKLYGTNPNWMEQYQYLIGHKKLTDLIVPASHDSGTYQIESMAKDISRCQQKSIYRQLEMGVRYLDIRYGKTSDKKYDVYVMHGPAVSISFRDALMEVIYFLNHYPKEFIIIKIQQEWKETTTEQRDFVIELIYELLFDKMITKQDKWFDIKTVTLNDILYNQKNILLCADKNIINRKKQELYTEQDFKKLCNKNSKVGIWYQEQILYDCWFNTECQNKLLENIKQNFDEVNQAREMTNRSERFDNIHVSQFILSAQFSPKNLMKFIGGCKNANVVDMTMNLNKNKDLLRFCIEHMNETMINYILMDFVDFQPCLIKY